MKKVAEKKTANITLRLHPSELKLIEDERRRAAVAGEPILTRAGVVRRAIHSMLPSK